MDSNTTDRAAAPTIDELAAKHDELLDEATRRVESSIDVVVDVRERIGIFARGRDIAIILALLSAAEVGLGGALESIADELLDEAARRVEAGIRDVVDVRERIGLLAGAQEIETILELLWTTGLGLGRALDRIEAAG
jgi:hypothetical protein